MHTTDCLYISFCACFIFHREYRRKIFGDKWLLPLNETGAGALDAADIDLLKRGWLVNVIHHNDHRDGRFWLVDHGRYGGHSVESFKRVAFYLAAMSTDVVMQTKGLTVIRLISSKKFGGEPPLSMKLFQTAQMLWKMVKEASPVRLKRVVMLKQELLERGNMVHMFLGRIGSFVAGLLKNGNHGPVTIPVPSMAETAETLLDEWNSAWHAILPTSHGGRWTYDRTFEWKDKQARECGTSHEDVAKFVKVPWLVETRKSANEAVTKQVNALHARRAYHKRKMRQTESAETAKRLRIENEQLRRDNALLESLVQQANYIVLTLATQTRAFDQQGARSHGVTSQVFGQQEAPVLNHFEEDFDPLPLNAAVPVQSSQSRAGDEYDPLRHQGHFSFDEDIESDFPISDL